MEHPCIYCGGNVYAGRCQSCGTMFPDLETQNRLSDNSTHSTGYDAPESTMNFGSVAPSVRSEVSGHTPSQRAAQYYAPASVQESSRNYPNVTEANYSGPLNDYEPTIRSESNFLFDFTPSKKASKAKSSGHDGLSRVILLIIAGLLLAACAALALVMLNNCSEDAPVVLSHGDTPVSHTDLGPDYSMLKSYGGTYARYYDPAVSYAVGDTFLLGGYEQDGNSENNIEAIEWRVLRVSGGQTLAVSVYCLDCKPYNDTLASVTWNTCSLRGWLNGEFYEAAFSGRDRQYVLETTVDDPVNWFYDVPSGGATTDRVFCLSLSDYKELFSGPEDRTARPTEYAVSRGAKLNAPTGNTSYWLRSPGASSKMVAYCPYKGDMGQYGSNVDNSDVGVRPAIILSTP